MLGPHTHTPAPTARGWRTPTARPAGGQSGEGRRLASDAPHNGARHPPRGRPPATPTASNAGLQGRMLWGRCWVPKPTPTAPGTHGSRNPDARSRGRAAGGGTAPDTRRPSQRWRATPPGDGPPPPPRHTVPTGHASQGDAHTPAPTARGWRPPTARPMDGQSGEGQRLTSDAPHHSGRRPPSGTLFRRPHSEQRRPARAHAVGPVLGPHARTDGARDTWVPKPWLPAPEDGRRGRDSALHQTPLAMLESAPPGDAHPPPPQRATHQRTNAPATGHPHPTPCS